MTKLEEELNFARDTFNCENPKAIFPIKNYFELRQIIDKLNSIGRCSNYQAWTANDSSAKKAFEEQTSDYIELCLRDYSLTCSTMSKFAEQTGKMNKFVIDTKEYLDKMVRKKLAL